VVSARVLYEHDRTGCVCNQPGLSVQIHHMARADWSEAQSDVRLEEMARYGFACNALHELRVNPLTSYAIQHDLSGQTHGGENYDQPRPILSRR
jgi:hypothetical protein